MGAMFEVVGMQEGKDRNRGNGAKTPPRGELPRNRTAPP
jgi:hypothetical protein